MYWEIIDLFGMLRKRLFISGVYNNQYTQGRGVIEYEY